jgi:membrane-bound ClpP family serine protease
MTPSPLQPRRPFLGRLAAAAVLAACALATGPAAADEGAGRLVKLKLPLTGNADQVFQKVLQRTADKLTQAPRDPDAGRPVLIIEFAGDSDSGASEFERSLSLARFVLRDLTGVKTVAYLPRSLKGHAVLVAMACEEIAMAPDAELGEAAAGEDPSRPIEPGMVAVYKEIAEARRNFPAPIAQGMIDRRLEVLKVEDETGVDFVLRRDLKELEEQRAIASTEIVSAAGSQARFSGREAWELGLVKYLVSGDRALARVLRLPAEAVQEDQATIADWKPTIIEINGELTPRLTKQVMTLIGSEIKQHNVNWIGFRINSGGGRMDLCVELASVIADLNADEVRTVAYVPVEAAGGAALVALACDQLILHPGAKIGGGLTVAQPAAPPERPGRLPPRAPRGDKPPFDLAPPEEKRPGQLSPEELNAAMAAIQSSLAENSGRSWSLLGAMVDPGLRVFQYTNRQTGEEALLSEQEVAEQPDADQWRQGDEVTKPGVVLTLDSEAAQRLGVSFAVLDDYDELKQLYGFAAEPPIAKTNWALELVEALANPWLAGILLLVGFFAIYIEVSAPGIGIGGFVAAVAFLLFFWSHFLSGTAEWLEVLLFLAGLFFILMEAFVLPGFGIFGLGGVAMMLASLVLVSQTFVIPRTEGQLSELRESLTMVVMSILGCLVAGFMLRRYLPHAPGLRRMMLAPADEVELAELDHRESLVDYTHLVGRTGEATTNLMPSGKADIDGELIDVIADGQVIDRGQPIVVLSARGSRVLVRKA